MKVLIVDDELLIRKTLQKVFEKKGHQAKMAVDGRDALEIWADFQPDLVILDVLMPNLGGVEVLQKIKSSDLGLLQSAIVMISAYSAGGTREDFIKLGALDFVRKPFEDVFQFADHCISLVGEGH